MEDELKSVISEIQLQLRTLQVSVDNLTFELKFNKYKYTIDLFENTVAEHCINCPNIRSEPNIIILTDQIDPNGYAITAPKCGCAMAKVMVNVQDSQNDLTKSLLQEIIDMANAKIIKEFNERPQDTQEDISPTYYGPL